MGTHLFLMNSGMNKMSRRGWASILNVTLTCADILLLFKRIKNCRMYFAMHECFGLISLLLIKTPTPCSHLSFQQWYPGLKMNEFTFYHSETFQDIWQCTMYKVSNALHVFIWTKDVYGYTDRHMYKSTKWDHMASADLSQLLWGVTDYG